MRCGRRLDLVTVGGHHDGVELAERHDALPHPDDER
jgi:hypothetical protein